MPKWNFKLSTAKKRTYRCLVCFSPIKIGQLYLYKLYYTGESVFFEDIPEAERKKLPYKAEIYHVTRKITIHPDCEQALRNMAYWAWKEFKKRLEDCERVYVSAKGALYSSDLEAKQIKEFVREESRKYRSSYGGRLNEANVSRRIS